jgi:uncharacterized membrane protein
MTNRFAATISQHVRFFTAMVCGGLAYGVARMAHIPVPLLAAGDAFYAIFLILCLVMIVGQNAQDLERRAKSEDEGIVIVVLITIATMGFFCAAVFEALAKKQALDFSALAMAGAGALLGWFVLHTVMAFHYANLHYFDDPETTADDTRDLAFPGCELPCAWDFLYFSFVVGMTCQVSDVQVKTSVMRKAVLGHGVASFFFNTVFIAMAVNAGVSLAG